MSKHEGFDFKKEGFTANCQSESTCDTLKYLTSLIICGPLQATNAENEQTILSIGQLICFQAEMGKKSEPPLPIYLGLLIHSKFRSSTLIDELSRLGLSTNYNRVCYLERMMGHSVVQQFNSEDLVCPSEMRTSLFTVAAVDNIDHNPTSTSSKDSFHGTAISLFQSRKHIDEGGITGFKLLRNPTELLKLPTYFSTLPELAVLGKVPVTSQNEINALEEDFPNQLTKEEQWTELVGTQLNSEESNQICTWSSYHAQNCNEGVPSLSGLFPLFIERSTDSIMIFHAMLIVKKTVGYLNPGQVPVITGNQPIFAIMKKLQWHYSDLGDMIVMLGGFHTEKHFLEAIGDLLIGSGWNGALVRAGIANPGTAEGILGAGHVTKSRFAHQITYVALARLLKEAYEEASPDIDFDTWVRDERKCPTFLFWTLVMNYEAVLLLFVRAHREGNFHLYVESLKHMVELFFACDHYNYARWTSVHIEDMIRLPPSILHEFSTGGFVVNKSNRRFSSIAIDQSHEQLNKVLKGAGGVIGITQEPASLLNWSVYSPEVTKQIEIFKIVSNAEEDSTSDVFHHDEGLKQQESFLTDVKCMLDAIKMNGNPFHEWENELVNLEGEISEDKAIFLIEETGQQQYQSYVKDVSIDKTKKFDEPIKKNRFQLFKATKKKRRVNRKLEVVEAHLSVFGKMFVVVQQRSGDIDQLFAHEIQPYPPSIANSLGGMYHSKKSEVLDCLQNEVDLACFANTNNITQNYDALVIDGGALIHALRPREGISTFEEYADLVFVHNLNFELPKANAVHLVWDSYHPYSIKENTRHERGTGSRLKIGPHVRLLKNWSEFLSNRDNKVQLFQFLNQRFSLKLKLSSENNFCFTSGECVRHLGPGLEMTLKCDHEEADTKIYFMFFMR